MVQPKRLAAYGRLGGARQGLPSLGNIFALGRTFAVTDDELVMLIHRLQAKELDAACHGWRGKGRNENSDSDPERGRNYAVIRD
ncbi:hypothetical protein GCM10027159_34510 [Lysobacter terrae]